MTSATVHEMLQAHIFREGWCYLREVRANRGVNVKSIADAVAVSLYPSRGHHLHGIEIKVSRSDWLRELNNPKKSHDTFIQCASWTLACPDGVVAPGELPHGWGHIVVSDKKARYKSRPKVRNNVVITPMSVVMLGHLLNQQQKEVDAKVRETIKRMKEGDGQRLNDLANENVKLRSELAAVQGCIEDRNVIAKFSEACGVSAWDIHHAYSKLTDGIKAAVAAMQTKESIEVAMHRFKLIAEQATKAEQLFKVIYDNAVHQDHQREQQ